MSPHKSALSNSINHVLSMKTPSSSSSNSSSLTSTLRLKTLLQSFIFSHMYRIARALAKAKSVLIQLLKEIHFTDHLIEFPNNVLMKCKHGKQQKKLFFGSFRLHYNWCSSDHARLSHHVVYSSYHDNYVYYDSSWNSVINRQSTVMCENHEKQEANELSKYLQWLEEKGDDDDGDAVDDDNKIDRLADLFIANCHEKFMLEKQESYRRFQEMMARSI